jgi:hypothetical protein
MRARSCFALALAAAALAWAGMSSAAVASSKSYECQHPTTTGQVAYNLKHVTAGTACKLVRALAVWDKPWYTCRGHSSTAAGTPVVTVDKFRGWTLSIPFEHDTGYTLTVHRDASSFQVGGTDWPVYCS